MILTVASSLRRVEQVMLVLAIAGLVQLYSVAGFVEPTLRKGLGIPRFKNVMTRQPLNMNIPADLSPEDEARQLREQAERLRQEVEVVELGKREVARAEAEEQKQIESQKQDVRMRYSAEIPILKGDGTTTFERVDFPPKITGGKSRIQTVEASLPLGIILGESEEVPGLVIVDEVGAGSNGEEAGVKIGDVVRACTACQVTMETPTWQLLAGGIGQPKTKRFMFSIDGRPFEEVMDAVASNRMDPMERPALLVLERVE